MHPNRFPDLSYEEYLHAAAHLACRIERMTDIGSVAIDQLIVKWYLVQVLRCNASEKDRTAFLHQKYLGAIQKMIADGLIIVLDSGSVGKHTFRVLRAHPQLCAPALWLSVVQHRTEDSTQSTR